MNKTQKLSDLINTALTDEQCIKTRSHWLLNDNTEKKAGIKTFSQCISVPTFFFFTFFEYSHPPFLRYQIAICGELFWKLSQEDPWYLIPQLYFNSSRVFLKFINFHWSALSWRWARIFTHRFNRGFKLTMVYMCVDYL